MDETIIAIFNDLSSIKARIRALEHDARNREFKDMYTAAISKNSPANGSLEQQKINMKISILSDLVLKLSNVLTEVVQGQKPQWQGPPSIVDDYMENPIFLEKSIDFFSMLPLDNTLTY